MQDLLRQSTDCRRTRERGQNAKQRVDTRTPDQIAADLAETRNRLAGTIDQLVYRIKPQDDRVASGRERQGVVLQRPGGRSTSRRSPRSSGIGLGVVAAIVAIRKIAG